MESTQIVNYFLSGYETSQKDDKWYECLEILANCNCLTTVVRAKKLRERGLNNLAQADIDCAILVLDIKKEKSGRS